MKKLILLIGITGAFYFTMAQDREVKEGRPDVPGRLFVDLGVNFLENNPTEMELDFLNSRVVNIYYQYDIDLGETSFKVSPGLGLGIDKYGFDKNITLEADENAASIVNLDDLLPNATIKNTQLAATYFDIPVDFWYFLNKYNQRGFKFGLGGKGGVRIDSKTKLVYMDNEERFTVKKKEPYNLNQFRYGVHAKVGYGAFYLWGYYSLSPLFESGKGPELEEPNNWTVGISIVGF